MLHPELIIMISTPQAPPCLVCKGRMCMSMIALRQQIGLQLQLFVGKLWR